MIYVPADMLPEGGVAKLTPKPALFAGQTVLIAPVTGVGTSNLRVLAGSMGAVQTAQIWGQTFQEALFKTVHDAGWFGEVVRTGRARYILYAKILQQTTAGYAASFKVHYVLHDTQSKHDLWQEDITATYAFSGSTAAFFMPYNTELKALMRACGKNIESLMKHLAMPPVNER